MAASRSCTLVLTCALVELHRLDQVIDPLRLERLLTIGRRRPAPVAVQVGEFLMDRGAPGVVLAAPVSKQITASSKRPAAAAVRACFRTPCADLGTRDQAMAITPTTATTGNTPENE